MKMKKLASVLLAAVMCITPMAVQAENVSLSVGKTVECEIPEDGILYCSIIPTEDAAYTIYSSSASEACDPFARLYDADFNEIGYSDDTDDGYQFKMNVILSAGEEYFLQVEFYSLDTETLNITVEKAEKDYLTLSATELKLETPVSAILPADGYHYYEFTPDEDGYYNFYSTNEDYCDLYMLLSYVYDDVVIDLNHYDDCFFGADFSATEYLTAGETYVLKVGSYSYGYGDIEYEIAVTQNSQEFSTVDAQVLEMGWTKIDGVGKENSYEKYYSIVPASDCVCYITGYAGWSVYEVIIGSIIVSNNYIDYPIKLEKDKEYLISIYAYGDSEIYLTEKELTLTPIDGCEYLINEEMRMITEVDSLTTVAEFKANFIEDIQLVSFEGEILEDEDLIYPAADINFLVDENYIYSGYYINTDQWVPARKEDSAYTIDEMGLCVYGIEEETTVAEFKENFEDTIAVYGIYYQLLDDDDFIATGSQIDVVLGDQYYSTYFNTVVLGDVNCNGIVNSTDFMQIRKYYLGSYDFVSFASYLAADTNGDGDINSTDFMRVRRHYLGTYNLYS